MRFALLVASLAAAVALTGAPSHAAFCGLKPLKPLVPLGCSDLVAVCVCDDRGQNCRWEWHCVQ